MFVYALKVAMDRGYIDSSYEATVTLGWQGLKTQVTGTATSPIINDAAAGLDPQATYAAYIDVARESNSSQGLCAILLAASEMESTCP
jgi:rhamnogalacturonyl hydrolase YesR